MKTQLNAYSDTLFCLKLYFRQKYDCCVAGEANDAEIMPRRNRCVALYALE